MLLLSGCGDPASGSEAAPPAPAAHGAAPSQTTHRRAASSPDTRAKTPTVLYLGDSLAVENQKVLGRLLRDEVRARYTSAPYGGTTLCDYLDGTAQRSLVPPQDKASALVRSLRPDVVVLQFWGNSWGYTPCMDGVTYDKAQATYLRSYAADAGKLTAQIAGAARAVGAARPTVIWVLQGPDAITPDRVRQVNAIYEKQARTSGDVLADAGKAVSPASDRYTWAQYLPCTSYERDHPAYCTVQGRDRTALHRDDDYLHFCLAPTTSTPKPCPVRSPGILRIARTITQAVAAQVR